MSSDDLLALLARRAETVRARFPEQAATLGAAIRRARREGTRLKGTAPSLRLNRHLMAEGERILALLRKADRDVPDDAARLEAAVSRILDRGA